MNDGLFLKKLFKLYKINDIEYIIDNNKHEVNKRYETYFLLKMIKHYNIFKKIK